MKQKRFHIIIFCILFLDTTCLLGDVVYVKEVKITEGEVKQKSLITNEETFEGFSESNDSLQCFDNMMIMMLSYENLSATRKYYIIIYKFSN